MTYQDYDDEDLPFLDTTDRLTALGLDPEETLTSTNYTPDTPPRQPTISKQRPIPGKVVFDLQGVARSRNLVHESGEYAGRVNLMAMTRGTDLAYTTILPLVKHPEQIVMLNLDTLARLCDFLDVQPGDILKYQRGARTGPKLSEQYKARTG